MTGKLTGARTRARRLAGRIARSRALPRGLRDALSGWIWSRNARAALEVSRRPVTFNEKTSYKMANDRRPLLLALSDKVAAREYVAEVIGTDFLPESYLVADDAEALSAEVLPREVVLKSSHASGGCVLIADFAQPDHSLPAPPAGWTRSLVRPDRVDWEVLRELFADWLARPYHPATHWANGRIRPRVLAEQLLRDGEQVPRDFKLFSFDGRVRMVVVDTDRYEGHVRSIYTPGWERLPFELNFTTGPDVERPGNLEEMIGIAERLSEGLDFLRVDLYAPNGRIVVGELTSYHGAGEEEFRPGSWDRWLGSWWTLPRRYR